MVDDIHKVPKMGSFLLQYGRTCYTTIQQEVTTWPIMLSYQIQNNEDIPPNIYSLSLFDHRIWDDKMSYELVEYPNKKIIRPKISYKNGIFVAYNNILDFM